MGLFRFSINADNAILQINTKDTVVTIYIPVALSKAQYSDIQHNTIKDIHHKKYGFNIDKFLDPDIIYGAAANTKKIFDMAVGIAPLPRTKLVKI